MVLESERAVSESAGCSAGASNVEGCLTGASGNAGQGGTGCRVVRVRRVKKSPPIVTIPTANRRTAVNQNTTPLTIKKRRTSAGTLSVSLRRKAVATDNPSTTAKVRGKFNPTEEAT